MTAGSGVVHSERTPAHLRDGGIYPVHGYQVWVALPKEKERMPAEFHHVAAKDLPYWEESGVQMRLVAGGFGSQKSPVPVYSPLYMMEWNTEKPASINPDGRFFGGMGDFCGGRGLQYLWRTHRTWEYAGSQAGRSLPI